MYFTFDQPSFLWLLFAVPLLVFTHLYFMHHARRKAILFGNFKTIERITGKRLLTKNLWLLIIRCLIVICLVVSAAGMTVWRNGERSPNDIVLVIDTSASMSTQDMGGTRIDAAKAAAKRFVTGLNSSASIAVVEYSGLAEIVLEPSTSKHAVLDAIDRIQIKKIGGTDIAGALVTGSNLLSNAEHGRVIILLTDGVASLSLYDDNPVPQALTYVRAHHVVVDTIGIGTQTTGSFIPGIEAQAALFDEQNLRVIANSTGGVYAWAKDPAQLDVAFHSAAGNGMNALLPLRMSLVLTFVALIFVFLEWGLLNTRFRLLP